MDYCVLNGFLVVILIQHCTSEGLATSNQSLLATSLQDVQALPHEPEVPPADVAPVMAPPSLKDVQQAMQEASEKVEGQAAEEVLKELLEKVVEAAMGQVEGGGEAKGDEAAVQKAVTEDALGADKGESDTKDVLEQAAEEKEVEGKDIGPEGGDTAAGKEQVVAEVDTFKDIAEAEERVVKKKGVTAAGSVEETTAAVRTKDGVEVINEALDAQVSQEAEGAASEEGGGELELEDNNEQVVLSKAKGSSETETHKTEPTLLVVKVALGEEQNVGGSDPGLVVAEAKQLGDVGGKEGVLAEETAVDENQGKIVTSLSGNYDTETTNTIVGEDEEEMKLVNPATGPDTENKQGQRVEKGGAATEEEAQGAKVSVATGGERDGDSEVSERSDNKEGEQQAGEAHDHLEPSRGSGTEHGEVLVLTEYDAGDSVEPSPDPSTSPSLGSRNPDDEESSRGNDIVTPIDDLLSNNPVAVPRPTLDNLVTDVLAPGAQSERNEAGWTNELVEDTAGAAEAGEPGLEAWKIGAITAAVFLIVETVVVVFYVAKHRGKYSASARQRACEEGRVEPEEATGGDCSDDTLPADNEQMATLHPPDVASTLTHKSKEQHEVEHATAMSSPTEEMAQSGAEPGASEELRTSML